MNHKNPAGFTLIELLLYIVIISILLGAITAFFGMSLDARVKNETINEVDQQGAFALDTISQTVRNATAITAPAVGATGSTLSVTVPTGGLSPTVFSLNSGIISMTEGANPANNLTSNLMNTSSLTFKNVSRPSTPGIVQISLTISRKNPSGRNEYDYTKTFTTSVAVRP